MGIVIRVLFAHGFPEADVAGSTFFFHLIGEEGTDFAGSGDMENVDLGCRFIGGTEVNAAETEESFPEGTPESDIENPVKADFFLTDIEDAAFDDEAVGGEGIGGEGPRKAEDGTFAVLPEEGGGDGHRRYLGVFLFFH